MVALTRLWQEPIGHTGGESQDDGRGVDPYS
jgi:hypothetical protein